MGFRRNLAKITTFLFLFGISPYKLNCKTNRFQCSAHTVIYTVVYFLTTSIGLIYFSYGLQINDVSTYCILTFLNYAVTIAIFYSTLINLMLNRKAHANFLNKLLDVDCKLIKLNVSLDHNNLSFLHRQHIFVAFSLATFCIFDSVIQIDRMSLAEHAFYSLYYFLNITITLIGYYVRCIANILTEGYKRVFEFINVNLRNDLLRIKCKQKTIDELVNCMKILDDLTNLKKEISQIFGVLLLLTSAFDFITVTIAAYKLIYYSKGVDTAVWCYFVAYHVPNVIKCVLLAEALNTLAEQVGLPISNILFLPNCDSKALHFFSLQFRSMG